MTDHTIHGFKLRPDVVQALDEMAACLTRELYIERDLAAVIEPEGLVGHEDVPIFYRGDESVTVRLSRGGSGDTAFAWAAIMSINPYIGRVHTKVLMKNHAGIEAAAKAVLMDVVRQYIFLIVTTIKSGASLARGRFNDPDGSY